MITYPFRSFTISVELVPPNPKELERNISKCASRVSGRMFRQAVSSSGCSKLRLPAMKPFFIIRMEYISSLPPAIHISWPVWLLVEVTGTRVSPKKRAMACASRASPMRVEVAWALT